jgi:hypothetical protein
MEVSVNFSPSLEDYDKVNTHKLQNTISKTAIASTIHLLKAIAITVSCNFYVFNPMIDAP